MLGAYAQWFVSNSFRKEALESKKLAVKLKDRVDKLSATPSYTPQRISKLNTPVAVAEKAADQAARKVRALKK